MGFDLGVFLTVVGAVMLSLESFSRIAPPRRTRTVSDYAMDIDPLAPSRGRPDMELLVASPPSAC